MTKSAVPASRTLPRPPLFKKVTALSLGVLLTVASTPISARPPERKPRPASILRAATPQKLQPGNLVLSRTVYDNNPATVTVGEILPPNCASTTGGCGASTGAPYDGTYPTIWNNDIYDGSFGVTSPIYLDQITPDGATIESVELPNNSVPDVAFYSNQLVTSFSSKSELALNLSLDGSYLTFMGYVAPVNALDVSNSNTPGAQDPTNPVGESYYRAVAQMDANWNFNFTERNAYSGNNGRAAILNNTGGSEFYYASGNAGNGATPQPAGVVLGAGAQYIAPSLAVEGAQTPPVPPTPLASFSITEIGAKTDKLGKDDNFRGLTVSNNVVYYSKGSGGNGANTIYFVDMTGTACPNGIGVPSTTAALPSAPLMYMPSTLLSKGLPNNMCILAGFPATSNKVVNPVNFPFGIWFANSTTLYVADEGDGYSGGSDLYTHAAAQTLAGLEKWVFDSTTNTWNLAYTLQTGLDLDVPYTVAGYPTGNNSVTGLPWAPAPDGLRNITGRVNGDGTVTIWAITSTVSGNGDQGADPNQLVSITDSILNMDPSLAAQESFNVLRTAQFGEALRGISFTPGTNTTPPAQAAYPVTGTMPQYNYIRGTYSQMITIRNNTSSAVTGPVYLEFQNLNCKLVNGIWMNGWPTLQIVPSGTTWNPGAAVTITATFARPFNGPIGYDPEVTQ